MQRLRGHRVGAILARLSFLLSFAVILSGLSAGAVRADEGPSPAVTTDAKDYRPGEIVTITGFSFLPGEIVTIAVQAPSRPDRFVESIADFSGSFTNTAFSPDEGDVEDFIKIVATGSQSGADRTAIGYFYDSTPAGPCPYVVDASLAASAPLSSKFKTIQEAITALPNPGPCTINIKAGTYTEAVLIDQVNGAAGASSANAVVIQPDPSNAGPVIVTAPGLGTDATTSYAFSLQRSKFVTLTGLTISGSARSAIRLADAVSPRNSDITIEGNDIANNNPTGVSNASAVGIGIGQARVWVVNNLVRNNGRMGIDVASSTGPITGPIYIVNNTIVGNISGGVARATGTAIVSLVNNLIVGNGTAGPGLAATCACGLISGGGAVALTVKNNMFYANGNGTISSTDIKDAAIVLDAGDSNNYVTCTGAGTGCTAASPAIVACTFAGCSNAHAASTEIFVGASDFHLKTTAPISPAIDRGLGSFRDPATGPDWVPAIDFDGNSRPQDGDNAGGSAVDIGFHEVVATVQNTSTSVSSSASGNTSSYGDLVTFTAVVTSGASPVSASSGTVSFYDGAACAGTQIGAAQPVGAGGQASVITSGLSTGAHSITACYSGVVGSLNASNGSVSQTVNKADQAITVTQHAPPTAEYNAAFTVAAAGGASGQPVVVAASGTCSASGNTITMTSGTGTCTVTFNQAGNANYNAAPQVTETATAQKAAQAIAVTQHAPPTAVYSTSFTVAGTGGGSGLPVTVGASGVCSIGGTAVTMTSGTGTCTVAFDQAGNANYNAAPQVTETTTAQKADQIITFGPLGTKSYGDAAFDVGATVSSTLLVTFGSQTVVTCTVAVKTVTIVHSGVCTIRASQAGNDNYKPAPDVAQTFGINLGPAVLWIGLRNSDDQGTQFDLRVEVYSGTTLVASGEKRCIMGLTRNPALAQQVSVPLTGYATGPASVKILTRIGTTAANLKCGPAGSHSNAVGLSLYFEATSRPSRVGDAPLYLHVNDIASTTAPVATAAKQKDSAGVNFLGGNPWKSIAGWHQ
jgi:Bacterial Ig-like domain (group 3)